MKLSTPLALALVAGVVGLVWSTRRQTSADPPGPSTPTPPPSRPKVGDLIWVSTRSLPEFNRRAMGDPMQMRVTDATASYLTGFAEPVRPPMHGVIGPVTVPLEDFIRQASL